MINIETIAAEYEYSTRHGLTDNARACLNNIRVHLAGFLLRYRAVIPEPALTEVLERACLAYGEQRPEAPFIDILIEHIKSYARANGFRIEPDKDAAHLAHIEAATFHGNGVGAFNHRNFSGRPEVLAIESLADWTGSPAAAELKAAGLSDQEAAEPSEPDSGQDAAGSPELDSDQDGAELDYLDGGETDEELSALIDSILGF